MPDRIVPQARPGAPSRRRHILALEFDAVFLVVPLGVGAEHAPVFLAVGIRQLAFHAPYEGGVRQRRRRGGEYVMPYALFRVGATRNDGELARGGIEIQAHGEGIHVLQIQAVVALLGIEIIAADGFRFAFPLAGQDDHQMPVIELLNQNASLGIAPGAGRHGRRRGKIVFAYQLGQRKGSLRRGADAERQGGGRKGALYLGKWSHDGHKEKLPYYRWQLSNTATR